MPNRLKTSSIKKPSKYAIIVITQKEITIDGKVIIASPFCFIKISADINEISTKNINPFIVPNYVLVEIH